MLEINYTELFNDLGNTYQHLALMVLMCGIRLASLLIVLSTTSDQNILSGLVRNGLTIWMAMFVAWGQDPHLLDNETALSLTLIGLKEGFIGLMLGYAMSTIFWAAEGIGTYIDNIAGYNNVQQTNPSSGVQSTPIGHFISQLAVTGFYMLGGLLSVISVLLESFRWWPLQKTMPPLGNIVERFVEGQITQYLLAVAKIAAPLLVTLVLIDLGFGVLSKTAEKLEANNLAQPVKGATAMLLVSFLLALYFQQLSPELALDGVLAMLRQWFALSTMPGG